MSGTLNLLKALVEPVRIRIYVLLKKSSLTVSELSEILGISQSNTSHHIKALRDLDLLTAEKTGQHTYYALNRERAAERHVAAILSNLETIGGELPELAGDTAALRRILAARSADTFTRWRMEQPDLPYSDIFAHLACGRHGRVLDVGCGEGDFFSALLLSFDEVVAIDIDRTNLVRAHEQSRGSQNLQVMAADAEQLPFADNTFTAIVLRMALSQIPNFETALSECARVASRGAFISIIDTTSAAGGSFRETLLQQIGAQRSLKIDFERALPRLFMLRLQKV